MADLGTDLSCVDDCTEDFALVSGRTAHLQALARRWTTDRGTLIGDAEYGTNLADYINDDMAQSDIAAMNGFAHAEAMKDDRTLECDVTVALSPQGVLSVTGTLQDAEGPFQFTIADLANVTAATLELS